MKRTVTLLLVTVAIGATLLGTVSCTKKSMGDDGMMKKDQMMDKK